MSLNGILFRQRLTLILMSFVLLAPAPAVLAIDGEDWVLVERFNTQISKANNGDVAAMYEVGRMYERGRGTGRDEDKAAQWFTRAADADNHAAKARLGLMYLDGRGVSRDPGKAYALLKDAANASVPTAQFYLAKMYEEGTGVRQDNAKALKWYRAAAKGGYYLARGRAEKLVQQQRARAQARAAAAAASKPKPAQAKSSQHKGNAGVMEVLQTHHWTRNNRPAGYLPSVDTRCEPVAADKLACHSEPLTRDNGFAVITYKTESILSNFNSADQFEVRYYHNVVRVEPIESSAVGPGIGEEEENTPVQVNVKLGKQDKEHRLDCELENGNTITCIKGGIRTLTFNRQ